MRISPHAHRTDRRPAPGEAAAPPSAPPLPQEDLGTASRLDAVIAAASPFDERLEGTWFVPAPLRAGLGPPGNVERFVRAAAPDDRALRALMEHRAGAGRGVGAGLRPVRLRDPRAVPPWAEALTVFLAAQPATKEVDDAATLAGGPLVAFRRAAYRLLPREALEAHTVPVTQSAYEEIVGQVVSLVAYLCTPALRFELQVGGRGGGGPDWHESDAFDVSRSGWMARLEALPGLAHVIGLTYHQWRTCVGELFSRLAADFPILRRELWDWADPGPLSGYRGDAGDRHGGGRSVALLRFQHGQGVAYKPKELRHAVAFMDLVTFLNSSGLSLDLPTRRVVDRGDYGWEERVDPRPADDVTGFARYYRRLGMLMRLEQFLDGRDVFADNVHAVGEHPVVVDLECLLYPRARPVGEVGAVDRSALLASVDASVRRTAMPLQPWVSPTDVGLTDIGCLSKAGDPLSASGLPALPLPRYRPWHGETVADPDRYSDEVIAGYEEMQAALAANRTALAAPAGPLALFEGAWARYIWRGTFGCYDVQQASVSPSALTDGASRETMLAAVLRGIVGSTDGAGERSDLVEIAEKELEAFRMLDVPLFGAHTDSTDLLAFDGSPLGGHLTRSAWDALQERVAGLEFFDLDGQRAVLSACLEAAAGGAEVATELVTRTAALDRHAAVRSLGRGARTDRPPSADELVAIAGEVAETLLSARSSLGRDQGWVALTWYPTADLFDVEAAPGDLLSGLCAPAVLFAELFSATGDPRWWTASRDALEEAGEIESRPRPLHVAGRVHGHAVPVGGLFGPGAVAYAAARCGPLLGDRSVLRAARQLVTLAREALARPHGYEDIPAGSAGLLCNLLRLRAADPFDSMDLDTLLAELTARAGAALIAEHGVEMPLPKRSRLPELFPTGRDGIAMALSRALELAPELVLDAGSAACSVGTHRFAIGRRGGRLAHLAVVASGHAELDHRVLAVSQRAEPTSRSSRELVAAGHEALLAARASGDERSLRTAAELVHALVARKRETGSWFPDRRLDDRLNLSSLDGLPAVGLLALQMLFPNLPSLPVLA